MKKVLFFLTVVVIVCSGFKSKNEISILSPDGQIKAEVGLVEGKPMYSVYFKGKSVISPSALGFKIKDSKPLDSDFLISNYQTSATDTSWETSWGSDRIIRNQHNKLTICLTEKSGQKRQLIVTFAVFNDGVAFKYSFPRQKALNDITITDELTEFNYSQDAEAWWLWADYASHEGETMHCMISSIQKEIEQKYPARKGQAIRYELHTPFTTRINDSLHLSIHEAALVNYSSMNLQVGDTPLHLKCALTPAADGSLATVKAPYSTPWRTIQISQKAGDLIESNLILNLNEPCKIPDTKWIEPSKYMGIWWGMHIGKFSFQPGTGNHGATTANALEYIDFASQHGIKGMLIEGWNEAIFYFISGRKTPKPDFKVPCADFDMDKVVAYAKQKGVNLISYHETCADAENYEKVMDSAMRYIANYGIKYLKVGYVGYDGELQPKGEHHYGQYMVNHQRKVIETAAKYHLMLIFHESIKPTGLCRTYPNLMTAECVRGQEYNAWSNGNPPDHLVTIPFTRMLAGPIDYTPGIFDILFDQYKDKEQVHNTLANQLACYVIIESPLQMAADLPENYAKYLDAFQFIKDIPVNWECSKVVEARIGDYITIARKDIAGSDWYLGSMSGKTDREVSIPLSFLDPNKKYLAQIYADGPHTNWENNPTEYVITEHEVVNTDKIVKKIVAGGGLAIRFKAL